MKSPQKPNILLIFSDQQHWQAMGSVDSFFNTPSLDRIAKESTVFERSFCTTPQCSPSRSSLLTGLYPAATDVRGNVGAAGGNPLRQTTIAAELQAAGYHTAYFGKWHLGAQAVASHGWDVHEYGQIDTATERQAVSFLKNAGAIDQPFALFISFNNPHDIYTFKNHIVHEIVNDIELPASWAFEDLRNKPAVQEQFMTDDQGKAIWQKPRKLWERYRDCYRSKVQFYDQNVGNILTTLKNLALWDNTIIIITSDHGDMDTNHGLIFKGPFMYEHMVRIPLLIRIPSTIAQNTPQCIHDVDVVNVDIVPTLRDLCGLEDKICDGISLAPLLTGNGEYKEREYVIGQYFSKQQWINPIRMIRTNSYKYNLYIKHGDELYDLEKDPDELVNLTDDPAYTKVKESLCGQLRQWLQQHHDPFLQQQATDRAGNPI